MIQQLDYSQRCHVILQEQMFTCSLNIVDTSFLQKWQIEWGGGGHCLELLEYTAELEIETKVQSPRRL